MDGVSKMVGPPDGCGLSFGKLYQNWHQGVQTPFRPVLYLEPLQFVVNPIAHFTQGAGAEVYHLAGLF